MHFIREQKSKDPGGQQWLREKQANKQTYKQTNEQKDKPTNKQTNE